MSNLNDMIKTWKQDPDFQQAYDDLKPEFNLVRQLINARKTANMTQEQVAQAMNTSRPNIARIESGSNTSIATLSKYAQAVNADLHITLVPNAETIEAINDVRTGNVKSVNSIDELMTELNAND